MAENSATFHVQYDKGCYESNKHGVKGKKIVKSMLEMVDVGGVKRPILSVTPQCAATISSFDGKVVTHKDLAKLPSPNAYVLSSDDSTSSINKIGMATSATYKPDDGSNVVTNPVIKVKPEKTMFEKYWMMVLFFMVIVILAGGTFYMAGFSKKKSDIKNN
jgi:hypothetical protein